MVFYEEARQTWYRPIDTVYSFCVSQISNDDLFRNEQTFCNSLYNAFQNETYFCYYMSNRHSKKYFFGYNDQFNIWNPDKTSSCVKYHKLRKYISI